MTCFKILRSYCATEPFVFLYFLTVGINITILPQLLLSKLCLTSFNATICSGKLNEEEHLIHQQAAHWNMIILISTYCPAIVGVLVFGTISDVVCKKYLLMVPPVAMAFQSTVYLLSANYMESHVGILVVGASVTCFYGDIQGAIILSLSYVAEITAASPYRSFRMAIVTSIMECGKAIGDLIGGVFLYQYGFVFVFSTSLVISFINLCYVVFILPGKPTVTTEYENIDEENVLSVESKPTCSEVILKTLSGLKIMMKCFSCDKRGVVLISLVASLCLFSSTRVGENAIIVIFAKHSPLSLNAAEIAKFLLCLNMSRGIGALIIVIIGKSCFTLDDYMLAALSAISLVITYVIIGNAKSLKIMYVVTPMAILYPLLSSSLRAAITKQVSPTHHGSVLAFTAAVALICVTITVTALNELYKMTESKYPGAVFLLLASMSAVILIISAILCIYSHCINDKKSEEDIPFSKNIVTSTTTKL